MLPRRRRRGLLGLPDSQAFGSSGKSRDTSRGCAHTRQLVFPFWHSAFASAIVPYLRAAVDRLTSFMLCNLHVAIIAGATPDASCFVVSTRQTETQEREPPVKPLRKEARESSEGRVAQLPSTTHTISAFPSASLIVGRFTFCELFAGIGGFRLGLEAVSSSSLFCIIFGIGSHSTRSLGLNTDNTKTCVFLDTYIYIYIHRYILLYTPYY